MDFTVRQKAALRALAVIVGILSMMHILSPHAACAAPFPSDRIAVTVEGHGPDVIFIPGLASSAHVWDAEAAKLKDRYRVHLIQVDGFAGAPADANATGPIIQPTVDAIDAYIRAEHLNRPAVIGHSLGGLMGLMLAKQHPEDVGRLMIVDSLPWYGMIAGPNATLATVQPMAARMRDKIVGATQESYAASEPAVMARMVKSKGPEAEAATAAAAASDHAVVARAMYEDFMTDMRPDLPAIRTPVVMLYPWDASAGAPQAMFDGLYLGAYAPLPNKTIVRIDGSHHFIQIDQPEAFDRQVQAFLKN
jgi:pimeloyl-ACP methyl ester carboxylesterase